MLDNNNKILRQWYLLK